MNVVYGIVHFFYLITVRKSGNKKRHGCTMHFFYCPLHEHRYSSGLTPTTFLKILLKYV